ncbi:SDR family oxidoreductase [Congregibacter variabilis]|uniref:SDR family oxidoreductase n=1 Tax=Congregibacter variabilis TaxID=3081200 RepID=A0ABZ0I3D8_9GAMM|nr:SDR family oxidoreductase [Congregibacter sp. IMCC43200]
MYPGVQFDDKVVWITGASSGIGEALAVRMSARGSVLVLSARNESELQRVATLCREAGASDVLVLPLDVSKHATMEPAAQQVLAQFGKIDLLINNAGVSQRSFCVDTDFDVYRQMMDINVLGQIALTQAVLPAMIARGEGHIAVTASVAGKVGAPMRTGYCAAKHAVMGFFDALRTEVAADGLQVTTITPGFIQTNVSKNALSGDGSATGTTDEDIAGGMSVDDCADVIIAGFESGEPEIAVGTGPEMALLPLKRENPVAAFQALEQMAAQLRQAT